jgi:hypothetical protein
MSTFDDDTLKAINGIKRRRAGRDDNIFPFPPHASSPPTPPQLKSKKASEYKARSIRWLWRDRFALGKLGLIGGLPDKGKGLISASMIAACSTGGTWPCGEGQAPLGNVLWFTAEDDIEDTVIPRLMAAGADLNRVHIVGMAKNADGRERMFNIATDLDLLRQKLEEVGDVVLVIIDPMSAYVGVGTINNAMSTDVRGMLGPLVLLAEEKSISVIGIMHFNKQADVTNAMLRIADSLAYVAAARHVYVVVDDADADEKQARLFVKAKNNLAPDAHALRYFVGVAEVATDLETEEAITAPYVIWHTEHVEVTSTEAMEAAEGNSSTRSAAREAEEFLLRTLAGESKLVEEVEEEARAHGISLTGALKRARKNLGVIVRKQTGIIDGKWTWSLPGNHEGEHR